MYSFHFYFFHFFFKWFKKKIRTEPRVNLGGSVLHTKCVHSIKLGGLGVCFERKCYKSREFGDIFLGAHSVSTLSKTFWIWGWRFTAFKKKNIGVLLYRIYLTCTKFFACTKFRDSQKWLISCVLIFARLKFFFNFACTKILRVWALFMILRVLNFAKREKFTFFM